MKKRTVRFIIAKTHLRYGMLNNVMYMNIELLDKISHCVTILIVCMCCSVICVMLLYVRGTAMSIIWIVTFHLKNIVIIIWSHKYSIFIPSNWVFFANIWHWIYSTTSNVCGRQFNSQSFSLDYDWESRWFCDRKKIYPSVSHKPSRALNPNPSNFDAKPTLKNINRINCYVLTGNRNRLT